MRAAWVCILLVATGCNDARRALHELARATPEPSSSARRENIQRITTPSDWNSICARPLNHTSARTEVVKFLIDVRDHRKSYFVDTERWPIHFNFARDRLGFSPWQHEAFNQHEYHDADRRFEMGSIVHYLDGDLWAMELLPGDNLARERIAGLLTQVRSLTYFGSALRFHAVSPAQERRVAGSTIPLLQTSEVYGALQYQPLTLGQTRGRLRIVRGVLDRSEIRPTDVVVLEHVPDDLPVVAGVITAELQAPLGHIAILCAGRPTPNMALRSAMSDRNILALADRWVTLSVGAQEWHLERALDESVPPTQSSQTRVPRLDRAAHSIRSLCSLGHDDVVRFGAKAAELGEACHIGRGEHALLTAGGFAVPFHAYLQHVEQTETPATITALHGASNAALVLLSIRNGILQTPVDPALVEDIVTHMRNIAPHSRWLVRSSSNAEDLDGFSGAGLYESAVVATDFNATSVAAAVQSVWASTWSERAYREREHFGVRQDAVAMALLIQPMLDNAYAFGVALTANPFYERRPAFFVNLHARRTAVTSAAGNDTPEQHLLYTYNGAVEDELLSRADESSLLLSQPMDARLADVLGSIHTHFSELWHAPVNAADVEFALVRDHAETRVVVLQVRPFRVRYTDAQRWH